MSKTKTVRLTNHMRESIRDALLEHRFAEEEKAVEAAFFEVADKMYNHFFSTKDQELMASLPQGWLPTDNDIHVRLGSSGQDFVVPDMSYSRRFPYNLHDRWQSLDDEHPLVEEYKAIRDRKNALRKARTEAKKQVWAVLSTITTANKLLTVWPEAKPFVEKYIDEPAPQLPALPIGTLNNLLKLGA